MENLVQKIIGISDPDQIPLLDKRKFQNLPHHIYWKDIDNRYHGANDPLALDVGLRKGTDALGHSDQDFWPQALDMITHNDNLVVFEDKSQVFFEYALMKDGTLIHAITHKAPWRSPRTNKVLGIMGISFISKSYDKSDTHGLTQRQLDCLYYLVRGYSIKQIARAIALSPRTVEHYLEAVKIKLNCSSRPDLIDKALKIRSIKDRL